jgi:hypothetical protein
VFGWQTCNALRSRHLLAQPNIKVMALLITRGKGAEPNVLERALLNMLSLLYSGLLFR